MNLTILGASPSFPNPGGATSGYLLENTQGRLLLECGHGVAGRVQEFLALPDLSAILITHMHPDHFLDLVPLRYAYFFQNIPAISLFLPPGGIETLTQLQPALGLPEKFFAGTFDVQEYDPDTSVNVAGFEIRFARTHHFIPAQAVRITSSSEGSRAFFYSSDTSWTDPVVALATNAALAVVEATELRYRAEEDDEHHGHLTPDLAGRLASEAGVAQLLLTHYWRDHAEDLLRLARASFAGQVDLAEERKRYTI